MAVRWRSIGATLLAAAGLWSPAEGQTSARWQRWEVHVDSGGVTVGDPVTIRFRLVLDERDLLFDSLPQPLDTFLDGVKILSVEKLRRQPNRDFLGTATVTFYRTGPQPVPVFGLPFMRAVKGISRGTIESDTLSVDVVPTLAAGNPALRDIRELAPSAMPRLLTAALTAGVLALVMFGLRRRRKGDIAAAASGVDTTPAPSPSPPDPYAIAVARLGEIERAKWSARGEVARHYELVTGVLRDYLEAAEDVPARERTTSELFWLLPPRLLEGELRAHYAAVFEEADLVKFARRRPGTAAAADFLDDARGLIERWRTSVPSGAETADAIR
ncbi:MAG: hypothetical protein ABI766_05615 [Gemmatimonadales bacterium]